MRHITCITAHNITFKPALPDHAHLTCAKEITEIWLIYHSGVLWTCPTMLDYTQLLFMNQFTASTDAYAYKKLIPTFSRYYWFIILGYNDHTQPYQTTTNWYLWISLLLLWFFYTHIKIHYIQQITLERRTSKNPPIWLVKIILGHNSTKRIRQI